MAYGGELPQSGQVHNGPSRHDARCCGTPLQVVALTREDGDRSRVELIRCSACGLSSWRLDGADVAKADALGALSRVFASADPRPAPARVHRPAGTAVRRPGSTGAPKSTAGGTTAGLTRPAVAAPRELAELLAGWQVLGAR